MMKRKWWILCGAVLSAVLIGLCFFGVRLRIAPRFVLSRALGSVLTQLDTRFENSPIRLLAGALDPEGHQKMELQLETEQKHLGSVRYDMTVHTQMAPNRILAEGTVVTGGKLVDLSLYLDENFAAVSSQSLVEGMYYGITYNTFSQDIRSRQILAALIGNETITKWEDSIMELQDRLSASFSMPELSCEDVRNALYGVLALKPEISRQEIVLSDGDCNAYVVSFQATGAQLAAAAESYRSELTTEMCSWIDSLNSDPQSKIRADFFLDQGKLVRIILNLDHSEQSAEILLHLGKTPGQTTIALECDIRAGEELQEYSVQIRTASDKESYQELLYFVHTENEIRNAIILDYEWDLSSGEMILEIKKDPKTTEQRLNLTGEGETLVITSQDIRPVLNLLQDKTWAPPAICTLRIQPGSAVQKPAYRNLDQWSMEDLLALLGGLGGLLGLKLS